MRSKAGAWLAFMVLGGLGAVAPRASANVIVNYTSTSVTVNDNPGGREDNDVSIRCVTIGRGAPDRLQVFVNGVVWATDAPACDDVDTVSVSMSREADTLDLGRMRIKPGRAVAFDGVSADLGEGDDTVTPWSRSLIKLGPGNDRVVGVGPATEAGFIQGEDGDDTFAVGLSGVFNGGEGNDTAEVAGSARAAADRIFRPGADELASTRLIAVEGLRMTGSTEADVLDASEYGGPVALSGGAGDDRLIPGTGDDTLQGGEGADVLQARGTGLVLAATQLTGLGTDVVDGIEAADLGTPASGGTIDASGWTLPATLTGGDGPDTLLGGRAADVIRGNGGDDRVAGGPGVDDLGGGLGNDTLSYAGSPSPVTVDLTEPTGGVAGELDALQPDFENLEGSGADDRLLGNDASNVIAGGAGNDIVDGRAAADALDGGPGRDLLSAGPGGPGDGDGLAGGDGADLVSYKTRTGAVDVSLGGGTADGSPGEGDQVGKDVEALVGGQAGDTLSVAPAVETGRLTALRPRTFLLAGGAGADRITGGAGNDAIGGGAGKDVVKSGAGNDAVSGGGGADVVETGAGNDRLRGNGDADQLDAGAGDDITFSLDAARDSSDCGTGTDQVYGDARDVRAISQLGKGAGAVARGGCDSQRARTTSKLAPNANTDATDDTISDGDNLFEDDGDRFADTDGDGLGWDEDWPDELDGEGDGEFGYDDFGDDFDDENFGDGFEDFDEAFGDEGGGGDGPETTGGVVALAAKRSVPALVACPKTVRKRCIGELTLFSSKGKAMVLGRATFAMAKGKRKTVRVRLRTKAGRKFRPAKKPAPLGAVIDARDSGTNLWQTTGAVRVRKG